MKSRAIPIALAAALIAACASTPIEDRYYSLVLDAAEERSISSGADKGISVGLLNIALPPFLDTRAMAMQMGRNEVRLAQQHFWAEPLDEAIAKTLMRDIAAASTAIDMVSGVRDSQACQVAVAFDRFHPSSDGRVLVSGTYVLRSNPRSQQEEFDLHARLATDGYASAVSALRDALIRLGEQIADGIENGDVCVVAPESAKPEGAGVSLPS